MINDIEIMPLAVYVAPATQSAFVADNAAPGTAWPSGWTQLGSLSKPIKFTYKADKKDIEVQNALAPVRRRKIKESLEFNIDLAELALHQLQYATGVYTLNTAPTTSVAGLESWTDGGKACLPEYMWGFEGKMAPEDCATSYAFRVYVWKATLLDQFESEYSKDSETVLALKFGALAVPAKGAGQHLWRKVRVISPRATYP